MAKALAFLDIHRLFELAKQFAKNETKHNEPALYGVTDGKAVGTYVENKFKLLLQNKSVVDVNSAAKGIDLPGLNVDIKVTSYRQPQSSCPFQSARQKIYGLGYSLLVFVYDKNDDLDSQTSRLHINNVIFIEAALTADYQTTRGVLEILEREGNESDLIAYMNDRLLPVDDIGAQQLAREMITTPPALGYLTISNALQWRLQYQRVIDKAGTIPGIEKIV